MSKTVHIRRLSIFVAASAFLAAMLFMPILSITRSRTALAQGGSGEGTRKPKPKPQPTRTQLTRRPATRATPSSTSRSASRREQSFTENLNGYTLEMVYVQGGTFMMGSPNGVGSSDEHPQHRVTVQSFFIGKYEVTQAQYAAVMGTNPSHFTECWECPVEQVSWNDAQEFISKLNSMQSRYTYGKYIYRLPTEAEWEYACRAGTNGEYAGNLDAMAWYSNNSGNQIHPVGQKQANAFGLYDMYGNVWEWVEDWYHDSYNGAPTDGSAWISAGGQHRVVRGGAWDNDASNLHSAVRSGVTPGSRVNVIGFRVAAAARTQ